MTTQPLIILAYPLADDLRARIEAVCQVIEVKPGRSLATQLTDQQRQEAVALLTTSSTPITRDELAQLPALHTVCNVAVGYDNISIEQANELGVLVCNTPGVLNHAVADLTFGLVLCVARGLVHGDAFVRSGQWQKGPMPLMSDVRNKTLGVLGMGRIGCELAQRAQAFGMDVIYHNRRRHDEAESRQLARWVERDELFRRADFVSVLTPLTPETRGSIGAREFALMKPSAYLVNTARGAVLDEPALVQALRERTIAGAALDVMLQEPLPADHPLCQLDNVVLQPHVGSSTTETRRAMAELAIDNLLNAVAGREPETMVNPEVRSRPHARGAGQPA